MNTMTAYCNSRNPSILRETDGLRNCILQDVSLSAVEDEMILGILIGLFVGVNAGFLIAALCKAAGRGEE